jgi:hypothetical protein
MSPHGPPPAPSATDATPRLSIRYTVSRRDILWWHLYLLTHNRVLSAFLLVMCLGSAWSNLGAPEMAGRSAGFKVFVAAGFTVIMFGFVSVFTIAVTLVTVLFRKYRGFLGKHELEIRDEGLVERTDINESLHRWAGFHKIVLTRRHLFIYVTDTNAHVVPRRCFASEPEMLAFRDELLRRTAKP